MTREWKTKSFKSGNSVALRVPASVGIDAGEEWRLVEDGEGFRLERSAAPARRIDLAEVWGACPDFRPLMQEERTFEERGLDWNGALLRGE